MNLKIFTENIEEAARSQIYELLAQPAFKDAKVRIMPDTHAGAGCVIGFTADLGDKVIPNVVGVDINCGVRVVELGKADIDLPALDSFIKSSIPAGFAVNARQQAPFDLDRLRCRDSLLNPNRLLLGIGSLGGGNHFIEVDEDADGNKYLVIHTGSRNLGLQVAKLYQEKAIAHCRENPLKDIRAKLISDLKAQGREREIQAELAKLSASLPAPNIPDQLCYIEGADREDYLHDMAVCGEYAELNRRIIASRIVAFLGAEPIREWESVHNYIDGSNMVRKGAIAAHKGQMAIIPLNMRDGSLICVGKGNPEWNESAPHGAGRLLSRSAARRTLSVEDFSKSMEGIYTTTADASTIDESPMAYKDADEIASLIGDTVEIIRRVRPIYNFKASDAERAWAQKGEGE